MSLNTFQVLDLLENTSGKNDKIKILKDNKDNQELVDLVHLALDFKKKFFMKKFNDSPEIHHAYMEHSDFIGLANRLANREITGHEAIEQVEIFLSHCDKDQQKWYPRVLRKDLRCGFSESSANKAGYKIPKFDVMLAKDYKDCKKMDDLLKDGIFVSPKFDGYRCIAVCDHGDVTLYSRNGTEYQNFPQVVETLERWSKNMRFVLDGEIMSDDFNAMQQTAMSSKSNKSVGDVRFHVFGYIPYAEWEAEKFKETTGNRLQQLDFIWEEVFQDGDPIVKVEHERVYRLDRVMELMKEYLDAGHEGAMGLPNIPYFKGKKSNKLLKFKKFDNWDCEILEKYEGEGKYVGTLGGVIVMQPNGVECDVGSGFTDAERDHIWNNFDEVKGRIIEVQYQEIIEKTNKMRFGTFQRYRDSGAGTGKR